MWIRRLSPWLERRSLLVVAVITLGTLSCQPSDHGTEAVNDGGAQTFEGLLKKADSCLERSAPQAEIEEVIEELIARAQQERILSKTRPRRELMLAYPDHDVALFLFDREYETLSHEAPDEALGLCEQIQNEVPGTVLDAMAFHRHLSRRSEENPEAFLALCEDELSHDETTRKARVALLLRAESYQETGRPKLAALDYLRFWALHPTQVEDMSLSLMIAGLLKRAGFLLEGDMIMSSPEPTETARFLHLQLQPTPDSTLEGGKAIHHALIGAYFRHAPVRDLVEDAAAFSSNAKHADQVACILFQFRIAWLAMAEAEWEHVIRLHEDLMQSLASALQEEALRADALRQLQLCAQLDADHLMTLSGKWSYARREAGKRKLQTASRAYELASIMNDLSLDLAEAMADGGLVDDPPEYLAVTVNESVELYKGLNNRQAVLTAYRRFLERYPISEQAPDMLIRSTDYYSVTMKMPAVAADTLKGFLDQHPEVPERPRLMVKHATLLYEVAQYEDSYASMLLLLAEQPECKQVVAAKLLCALCEAAMGLPEEAETRLLLLIEEHPSNSLAAQSLHWIAGNRLLQQDYEGARSFYVDLIERYPDSKYTQGARDRVKKLEQVLREADA